MEQNDEGEVVANDNAKDKFWRILNEIKSSNGMFVNYVILYERRKECFRLYKS